MFFAGVSFAFFVLHALLYLFHRREPGNLYLAVSAFGFALFESEDQIDRSGLGPLSAQGLETIGVLGISIMILGFIRFGHHFTGVRGPNVFRFFVAGAALVVVANAMTGSLFWPQVLALLSLVELVRILAGGLRRPPRRHSWVVGLGFLAILLSAGIDTLSGLGLLPPQLAGTYPAGMMVLFLAISIYLSWSFADTQRDLELKLQEVEELTRQAVEQERREQRRELERQLLEQEHERQARELDAAREVQLSMLPERPPQATELEVDFEMRTASEVGGDFYDYHEGDGGALTLAVGDATGHGMEAGLLVAATKGLFHSAVDVGGLDEVLARIDEGLCGLRLRRRFMALVLLRFERGELAAVSAGMPPLLVYRQASGDVEEIALGAPPLASLTGHGYRTAAVPLATGDTLLACSDGLAERLDERGEPFGYRGVASCLADVGAGELREVREALFAAADAWAGGRPRADDETVVLLRRLPLRARD